MEDMYEPWPESRPPNAPGLATAQVRLNVGADVSTGYNAVIRSHPRWSGLHHEQPLSGYGSVSRVALG